MSIGRVSISCKVNKFEIALGKLLYESINCVFLFFFLLFNDGAYFSFVRDERRFRKPDEAFDIVFSVKVKKNWLFTQVLKARKSCQTEHGGQGGYVS